MKRKSIARRYYYAWTAREVIIALGLNESIPPAIAIVSQSFRSSIAQLTLDLVHKDVTDPESAIEARGLMSRIHNSMNAFGYWTEEKCRQLQQWDERDHFDEPA